MIEEKKLNFKFKRVKKKKINTKGKESQSFNK